MMFINICFMERAGQLRRRIGIHFMKMTFVDVSTNWNSMYDKHEDGVKIRFSLKLRTFFQLSPRTYKRVGETIVEA